MGISLTSDDGGADLAGPGRLHGHRRYVCALLTKSEVPFAWALSVGGGGRRDCGIIVGRPAAADPWHLRMIDAGFGEIVRVFLGNFEPPEVRSGMAAFAPHGAVAGVG